jgi:hypothetical protein
MANQKKQGSGKEEQDVVEREREREREMERYDYQRERERERGELKRCVRDKCLYTPCYIVPLQCISYSTMAARETVLYVPKMLPRDL